MGRRDVDITVSVSLSDHHSEEDNTDAALARDLAQRIKALAEEPKYRAILVFPPDPNSI